MRKSLAQALRSSLNPSCPSPICVQGMAPGYHPAASPRALLPVVHVVLFEGPRGAEALDASQSHRFFHRGWGDLIDIDPRPHLGFLGSARVPDTEGPRGGAEEGKVGKYCANDGINQVDPRPQSLFDLWADLLLIGQDLWYRRLSHVLRAQTDSAMTVAGRHQAAGGGRFGRHTRAGTPF